MSDSTIEVWRAMPGFEDGYQVSDLGNARSLDRVVHGRDGKSYRRRGQPLKQYVADGYCLINPNGKTCRVHVLVAAAFIGPRPPGLDVCHGDSDGTNNAATNLRYDTPSGNAADTIAAGHHHKVALERCCRGHLLIAPNLKLAPLVKRGHRECLACGRAWNRKGDDMQAKSDTCYREIMRQS